MTEEKLNPVQLREELNALEQFLESPGYRAAKKVIDSEIQDGINILVHMPLENETDLYKLLEARGEVRAHQAFSQKFYNRRAEIKELLAKEPTEVLDD